MGILSINNLKKEFDGEILFENVSLLIEKNDKLGIIGKNGTGKTTLLKILMGLESYSSGDIYINSGITISYMSQNLDFDINGNIYDYCKSIYSNLLEKEKELEILEKQMLNIKEYNVEFDELLIKYENKRKEFEDNEGYIYKSKIKGILIGLGFNETDFCRKLSELSGGEVNRLNLARLLLIEPDLLLLDEPTNHLDINACAWLENYLKNYKKAIIVISHDRYFLDSVTNKILELENKNSMIFDGNYTQFKDKKSKIIENINKHYFKQEKEIKRQEELISLYKSRGTEKLAKRAKSREKMLDKIDKIDKYIENTDTVKLDFKFELETGNDVLSITNICKKYSDNLILDNISFVVKKNQKIGIIGNNGVGKSTLLKIIANKLNFDFGEINYGSNVKYAYYSQNFSDLNEENNIVEEISDLKPNMTNEMIRKFLGKFLFSNDDVFKKIKYLSGGEKARVVLSKLLLQNANLLLLDEPTNHLDIYTREILENALVDFTGTIIIVSHDRYFLNSICTDIYELEKSKITHYLGNYDDYLLKKNQDINIIIDKKSNLKIFDDKNKKIEKEVRKQERILNIQIEKNIQKLKNKITKLEEEIENLELKKIDIDNLMCNEENYSDFNKLNELSIQKNDIDDEIENKYNELCMVLEELSEYEK